MEARYVHRYTAPGQRLTAMGARLFGSATDPNTDQASSSRRVAQKALRDYHDRNLASARDVSEELVRAGFNTPILDTDAVVLGTLMTLTPDTARPHLARLTADDFPHGAARDVFTLMSAMVTDNTPSLDPATVAGHAQRTFPSHRLTLLTRFLLTACTADVPAVALDFHIGLLLEATYRRHIHTAATRLTQIADTTALADLNTHIHQITTDLHHHHARTNQPTAPRTTNHSRRAV